MNRCLNQLLCRKCRLKVGSNYQRISGHIISRNYSVDIQSYIDVFLKLNRSIANSEAVNSTKDTLIAIHEWTHLSWSLEIALITTAIRALVTFPLSVSQHKILAKYESLSPEMNRFGQKLKKEIDSAQYLMSWSPLKAKMMHNLRMKEEMRRLIVRDNCHPVKASLVIWIQIPIWVIMSHSIRNMVFMYPRVDTNSQTIYDQLTTQGMLWFPDLTQTDPYYLLPFITAAVNLTIVQLHSNERLKKMANKTRMHSIITNCGRGLTLLLIPIGLRMPSAVCLYWFMSSSMGLIQNLILRNKGFKRLVGIKTK